MRIKIPFTKWDLEFRGLTEEEKREWYKHRYPVQYLLLEVEDLKKEIEQLKNKTS